MPSRRRDADLELLRKLVTRHQEETELRCGRRPAGRLGGGERRFTKVLPRDYARVLAARDQAESEGLDEAATTSRMMEAAHG